MLRRLALGAEPSRSAVARMDCNCRSPVPENYEAPYNLIRGVFARPAFLPTQWMGGVLPWPLAANLTRSPRDA
jgi:hypothetical protein